MKSKDSFSPLRLTGKKVQDSTESKSLRMEASVLAKLAEDVIALNCPHNPSELADNIRPARVARLDSLRCGLKILRKEESKEGELKSFIKE